MSMTQEHAEHFKNEPAVVCCRATKGTVLTAAELEDPGIFPDMIDAGLIVIPADAVTVGQALGATLLRDVDGLTCLTAEMLDGVAKSDEGVAEAAVPAVSGLPATAGGVSMSLSGGMLSIKAQSITNLELNIPLAVYSAMGNS